VRNPSRMPLAAAAALALLAASSACAPSPHHCSPQTDRFFDPNRGFTRERYAPVHPVTATTAVAVTVACLLAGHRFD
jgi:hypothetical protein